MYIFNTGIVRVLDWFKYPSWYIIVMEKPKDFEELGDYVKKNGRLEEKIARKLFSDVRYFLIKRSLSI